MKALPALKSPIQRITPAPSPIMSIVQGPRYSSSVLRLCLPLGTGMVHLVHSNALLVLIKSEQPPPLAFWKSRIYLTITIIVLLELNLSRTYRRYIKLKFLCVITSESESMLLLCRLGKWMAQISHLLFIPWSWWYEYMNSCHKKYPTRSTNCVCRLHLPCCFGVVFYKQQHNWWIIDGAIMAVPFIKLETNKHCAGANGAVLSRIKLIPVAWRLFIRRQMLI